MGVSGFGGGRGNPASRYPFGEVAFVRLFRRRKPQTVRQEDSGKHIHLELAGEGGKPVLGYALPKDVQDRARKIREQARELRVMAERLERIADDLEKRPPGGKLLQFVSRYFGKKT